MSLSQFSLVCFIKEMCPYLQNIDSYNQLPHLASFQISSHSDQITADVACQIYSHSLFTSLQSWVYLPVISSEPIFFSLQPVIFSKQISYLEHISGSLWLAIFKFFIFVFKIFYEVISIFSFLPVLSYVHPFVSELDQVTVLKLLVCLLSRI